MKTANAIFRPAGQSAHYQLPTVVVYTYILSTAANTYSFQQIAYCLLPDAIVSSTGQYVLYNVQILKAVTIEK